MSFSYKEFPEDVLNAFESIIKVHNMSVERKEDYYVGLSNKHVKITFAYDKGDLYAELRKKNDDFTFAIYQVYRHLYGTKAEANNQNLKSDGVRNPKADLVWFAKLFENELSSILTGDFSWYEELRAAKEYENQLVSIVLGPHLNHAHPISQKFWKGDSTWREDVEQFIRDKGIELKPTYNSTLPKAGRSWWQKLLGPE